MSMAGMVVVKDVMTKFDAENVAAFLRAQGLNAMVVADDAGGTIPSLDESLGAQVFVPEAEADRARALLAEQEDAAEGDESEPDAG